MCDCFHLAFPNWHAPAAGAGRRIKGPEHEAEDNSVCEEAETVEKERPRPQGSSPVEEFPIEKQAEGDISNSAQKSGSNKKGRKAGFGALFDKRASDKMNDAEDMQCGESEIIVKTVKEPCVEGLVVTGGGKEGIFIKEVKSDSTAFKELSVKEGDQILSATVYFDNVSYEDALQILEHAQPYKMEFCLRRKVELTLPENAEKHPKEKDQGPPMMRNPRKLKKEQERISWPKFTSFGKGPRMQFKRSFSTSEAEEHRKLEISPPTSDTESPIKSQLKGPNGKDKKKKHKVQLKMKMKGHGSKSVEESQSFENEFVWENQQVEGILEEKIPEGHEEKMQEIPNGAKNTISIKTRNEETFQSFSEIERHETHLISLGNTLKTTDISVAFSETKIESSRTDLMDKPDSGTENQAESTQALHTFLDSSASDNVAITQTEVKIGKLDHEIHKQEIDGSEKNMESKNPELSMPNLDICVGVVKTSPMTSTERQLKEKSVFENESYGIRTRGPLADMATSKSHFVSTVNGLQFMSPDFSEIIPSEKMFECISYREKVFQPKPSSTVDDTTSVKSSKLPREACTSEFKLPKVDLSGLVTHERIVMIEDKKNKTNLPKREDIEIPGMENKELKIIFKTPEIKVQKIINITNNQETEEEFNVEDVREAVSKFPAFKLPEGDITGVLVQREIELKSTLSPRGSPHKISITSTDSTIIPMSKMEMDTASDAADNNTVFKMPKVEPLYIDGHMSTDVMKIEYTQSQLTDYERFGDLNFNLPKREDIEIPGMEATKETNLQNTVDLNQAEKPRTKKHGDKTGHEKKLKKPKINIQGLESTKANIGIDLPKLDSNINTEETKILEKQHFKTPNAEDVKNIEVQIQETKILEHNLDNMTLPQKIGTKFGKTKFKIPSVTLPECAIKVPREEADISIADVQGGKNEDKIQLSDKLLLSELNGTDINKKDSQPVNVHDRPQDTETEGQGRKFKLPKFEISFPEVKAPKISCASKKDDDSSQSEESVKMEVHSTEGQLLPVKHTEKTDGDSQISEVKIKRTGFSLPRFGMSKTEPTVPAADVTLTNIDMSSPEGHTKVDDPITIKDCKDKDATKFSSPTKFKIPSIRFPHFGVKIVKTEMETSDVEVDVKGPETRLPDTKIQELKFPDESILVDIKEPDIDKPTESVNIELINMDIQSEAQVNKFKLPKIGVRLPELKGPKININAETAGIDISKPERKVQVNPGKIEVQHVTPKVSVDVTELTLPDAYMKITEPLSVDINRSDVDKEIVKMKDQDIQIKEKGTTFEFPKSEIDFPEVKMPKGEVILDKEDIFIPKAKVKIQPSDVKGQDVTARIKANLPEVDTTDIERKKTQGFLFPEIQLSKTEVIAPEADITLANVDVSLPEGRIETERMSTDVTLTIGNAQQRSQSKFGSPTKFKLPTINFPKFGTKDPKALVEVSGVDVSVKSDAEVKLSTESETVNVKLPDVDKEIKPSIVEMTDQNIQIKEKGNTFKLPKFGINLPKLDVNLKKVDSDCENAESVTSVVKADLPEVDSKTIEMKIKSPGFSFPIIGFGKSEVKAPEGSASFTDVDMSLPKERTEIERPMKDADQKVQSKFGSPTKYKLPSVSFPRFGTKGQKASLESPDVDIDVKEPEITFSYAQMKCSAAPLSMDIKELGLEQEMKPLCVKIQDPDMQIKDQKGKFHLPNFGIRLPEIKRPEIDLSLDKAEIDISMPKIKVHLPDAELQCKTAEIKADLPGVDSKDINVFLPEKSIDIERPSTDITVSLQNAEEKDLKYKMPSISFPKFGTKGPKELVKVPDVDVDVKGPEITLTDADIKLSDKIISMELKGAEVDKEIKPPSVKIKDPYIQIKEKESKFKLPKFGISLPDVKEPKVDVSLDKVDSDIAIQKANLEVHSSDAEMQGVTAKIKADLPEVDSKEIEFKMKMPGFSLPKFGFGKSDDKDAKDASSLNVNLPLDEGSIEIDRSSTNAAIPIGNEKQIGQSKFGSPTKFKLPTISFPKFGSKGPKASELSDIDVDIKGPGIVLPDAEIKLPAEALSVDIKGPDAEKEIISICVEMENQNTQIKKHVCEPKLPKVKGPKIDVSSDKAEINIIVPKAKINSPDADVSGITAKLKADPSEDIGLKLKMPGFSIPNLGFSKSKVKATKSGVSLANVDVPEKIIEMEKLSNNITIFSEDTEQKDTAKFTLPSVSFPKFGTKGTKASVAISDVDVDVKGPTITLPDAETNLSAEPFVVDIKPGEAKEIKPFQVEIKEQKIQLKDQESKFKLPNFGITLPELKGPKIDINLDKVENEDANLEVAPYNAKRHSVAVEIKADVPEVDSTDPEIKIKTTGISFSKIDFSKLDVKASKGDVGLQNTDMALPKESLEIKRPSTDASLPIQDEEQKHRSKFGSPTKFKLPSINFPKFGTKSPKASVEVSDMDVDAKEPKINLPDAKIKLAAEPLSVDIKGPEVDKEIEPSTVNIKDQDTQLKEKKSKCSDISHGDPPDAEVQEVTVNMKSSLPKVGYEGTEVRIKTPGFSLPKIGFSKSEVKASERCGILSNVDVSLTEECLDMEKTSTNVTMSVDDSEEKDPTNFKMPSITFLSGSKSRKALVGVSDADVAVKGPDISLPVAKMTLPAEVLSVDMKSDAEKETKPFSLEIKDQNIQMKKQGSKFKLPKFGISLSDVKRPKMDKAEIELSVPEANLEIHPPYVEVQGVPAEIKIGLPDVKDLKIKMETPDNKFSKSKGKNLEGDVSLSNVDMYFPEGSIENKIPSTDISITMENTEQRSQSKFSSPTKIKLPSVNFPKFGIKGPKPSVEVSNVDVDAKGPEITLPDAEIQLSAKTISMDIKEPDLDTKIEPTNVGLQEIKGPKVDLSFDKVNSGILSPEAKVEIHPVDTKVHCETDEIKADLPEVDSKDFEMKIKKPGLLFPKIGFSKSEVKPSEGNVNFQNVHVAVSEESVEFKRPVTDVTISDTEHKVESKFGSPTKFKLPSINFPKFGTKGQKASVDISDVDRDIKEPYLPEVKGPKIGEGEVDVNIDMSLPEGSIEIEKPSTVTEQKNRQKFGSPTKFKLPSINLPIFGSKSAISSVEVCDVDVDVKGPEINQPDAEIKLSSEECGNENGKSVKMKDQDIQVKKQGGKFKMPKFEIGLPEIKAPRPDARSDKIETDISVLKGKVEKCLPDAEMHKVTGKNKVDLPEVNFQDTEVKMRTPGFSFPGTGFSKPEGQVSKGDVTHPDVNACLPEGSKEIENTATHVLLEDAEQKDKSKLGSPRKIKLPSINFPKFGTKGPKASVDVSGVDVDVKGPQISLPSTELKLSNEPIKVDDEVKVEKDIPPLSVEVNDQDMLIKDKGNTVKLPKFGISIPEVKGANFNASIEKEEIDISVPKAKLAVHSIDAEVQDKVKADLSVVESKDTAKKFEEPGMPSPKFCTSDSKANNEGVKTKFDSQMEKCEDGDAAVSNNAFEVIFDTKQNYTKEIKLSSKFLSAKLGDVVSGFDVEFNVPAFDEIEETKKKYLETLKQELKLSTDYISKPKDGEAEEKASGQKQTSNDYLTFQFDKKADENESKKVFTGNINEDNVSPTLSLSSSEAFADESSALTSEHFNLSLASPTVVKVKYSANAEESEVRSDIITLTARSEVISMDPHQPEKVNIPFSSETSSSSLDTLKQMSGHIVVSNVQSMSKTEHAAILTRVDTLPLEKAIHSMSAEETVIQKGHTIVEKHIVKKIFDEDKEKISVTQKIQVFEGDASVPIFDDTASSIQKLKDTVHTEKLKFFEGAESSKTVIMSTQTLSRHADSSTNEQ